MKDEGSYELVDCRLEQAQTALDDAKFLLDGNRSPQSIVNRSYYAMFYTVLALLQSIGRVPSKHSGTISIFDTEFVRKGTLPKELSRDLHKAFQMRQISDYRIVEPCSFEEAKEILDRAVHFVAAVKAYLGERK